MDVPEGSTVVLSAGVGPNDTVEFAVKPTPFMVTVVPPLAGPEDGFSPVTTGT